MIVNKGTAIPFASQCARPQHSSLPVLSEELLILATSELRAKRYKPSYACCEPLWHPEERL
eukprot:4337054-Pleurochrysis_carterae.AAC.1